VLQRRGASGRSTQRRPVFEQINAEGAEVTQNTQNNPKEILMDPFCDFCVTSASSALKLVALAWPRIVGARPSHSGGRHRA
jgi:hypothetical protein